VTTGTIQSLFLSGGGNLAGIGNGAQLSAANAQLNGGMISNALTLSAQSMIINGILSVDSSALVATGSVRITGDSQITLGLTMTTSSVGSWFRVVQSAAGYQSAKFKVVGATRQPNMGFALDGTWTAPTSAAPLDLFVNVAGSGVFSLAGSAITFTGISVTIGEVQLDDASTMTLSGGSFSGQSVAGGRVVVNGDFTVRGIMTSRQAQFKVGRGTIGTCKIDDLTVDGAVLQILGDAQASRLTISKGTLQGAGPTKQSTFTTGSLSIKGGEVKTLQDLAINAGSYDFDCSGLSCQLFTTRTRITVRKS